MKTPKTRPLGSWAGRKLSDCNRRRNAFCVYIAPSLDSAACGGLALEFEFDESGLTGGYGQKATDGESVMRQDTHLGRECYRVAGEVESIGAQLERPDIAQS